MFLLIPDWISAYSISEFSLIGTIIIVSWAILMIVLEQLYPYQKDLKIFRRGFWLDLVWYTLIQSYFLQIVIFEWIIKPIRLYAFPDDHGLISHWPFWAIVLFFLVTHDFYIYWFHRLQHQIAFFWRTHEAHHSVRDVDWLAGSRSHFTEILINQTIEFLPIFLLLDAHSASYMVIIKGVIDATWGMWIHANVDVRSGKLQYFFNGPEMHQWHHANHHEVFYKNFSTKLAIWDWLFGTGFLPGLKPLSFDFIKPKIYGLPYAYPNGFFSQLIYALVRYDFSTFENKTLYRYLLLFRQNFVKGLDSLFSTKIYDFLFDTENKKYEHEDIYCHNCGQKMKYYYLKNQFTQNCQNCNPYETLEKFS
ncbi:MAG: sterol desaturase family protein [Chitinophagales bacterium]|jgi:sterol desaturase/sphingolipid hydroxylase (fatty acid hydroxylase superfamily)|nr:sterol desaturase family protein [Chitinophagales bacterium]